MKLLNEVIAELIKVEEVFQPEPEDSFFHLPGTDTRTGGTEDPEDFCDACKVLGFCKIAHPELYHKHLEQQKQAFRLSHEEIRDLIPLKENENILEIFGEFKKEQLQRAHEAFNQQDYERAILHYKAFWEKYSYEDKVHLYLAICYYFMENQSAAIEYAERIKASHTYIENFKLHCMNVMRDLNGSKVEIKENILETV